jgi:hypothetical protein
MTSMLNVTLTNYQKGVYYAGLKLLNTLPPRNTSLHHDLKIFKPALKGYHLPPSFYCAEKSAYTENY